MKKLLLFMVTSILLTISLWAYSNDWVLDQSLLDNNETSYTLNYAPNQGKPLSYTLTQIDKAFSIRIMLPYKNTQLQKELRTYYKKKMPNELKKALKASRNLHNPALNPLIEAFPLALRCSSFFKKLEKDLNKKGYWIDKEITFEKFGLSENKKPYLFSADIWLTTTPFLELIKSAKVTFPNFSEDELKIMFYDGFWNYEKSAVVVYPSNPNRTSIYIFFKNKLDEFMGIDISRVEKVNLGTIGSKRHFDKVETKVVKWLAHEKYYRIKVETKAWSKGQRYRHSEELLVDKSAKVLWR